MKFYETHFEDYIISNERINLHAKLDKIFQRFPNQISNVKNLIFYGPPGTGKYTQMLKAIKKYSPSELKYEKKITICFNKFNFSFKLSDIHYEIDMSLLGCNSKILWHEIYQQIIDIVSAKSDKSGIIICKNFHEIHSELLDNFYSYMQQNNYIGVDLKFFINTEQISFIPDSILNCCEIINISRPSKNIYNKCLKTKLSPEFKLDTISNIKNLYLENNNELMVNYKIICNKIINEMLNIQELKFLKFRDLLYDIFIYNLDITQCIWYILYTLIKSNKINSECNSQLMIKTYQFLHYYNNNYRPIYHLENYLFCIVKIMYGY